MESVQAECNTKLAQIACHTTPAQGRSDMQFVQAESHTQCAQIACYTSPAQVWSDMQSVTHSTIQSKGEPPIRNV